MTKIGRPDRRQAGFTVLELLVVLVMIGVLLGVGIPVLINYLNSGSNTTAQSNDLTALQAANTYYQTNQTNQNSYDGLCPSKSCGDGPNPSAFAEQGSGVAAVNGYHPSPNPQTVSIWVTPDGLKVVIAALANDTHTCWVVIQDRQAGRVDLGYKAPFSHLFVREKAPKSGKTTCNAGATIFLSRVPDVTDTNLTAWPASR